MQIDVEVLKNTTDFTKVYEKMVYVALHIDTELSVKEIADICICSETSVRHAIKHLESIGLITVERRVEYDGQHLPNRYIINRTEKIDG